MRETKADGKRYGRGRPTEFRTKRADILEALQGLIVSKGLLSMRVDEETSLTDEDDRDIGLFSNSVTLTELNELHSIMEKMDGQVYGLYASSIHSGEVKIVAGLKRPVLLRSK